jgi:hypothetical protein
MKNGGDSGIRDSFLTLFREVFNGPEGREGMFLNSRTGIHDTLEKIDARAASEDVAGSSIAAHAGHLVLYLEVLGGCLKGEVRGVDWEGGWLRTRIDAREWDEMRSEIRSACEAIEKHAATMKNWNPDDVTMTMALTIHSAYHLGAIRQMIKQL